MNYTLHQLKVFHTVAELKSITKAAEMLHLTQPAVSIQLKNFQEQFDIPLTEIVGRQLYLTEFGAEIAEASDKILKEVEGINQKVLNYQGQLAGSLKVAVVSTGKYIIPYFLTDFLAENPGVKLKMDVTNKHTVMTALEQNEIDFALISILPERLQLNSITLMNNELYFIGNRDSELDTDKKHDIKVLESIDLIFRESGSGTRQTLERYFNQNKLQIHKKLELTSNEAVKQAVVAGLGYSILPLIGLKNALSLGDLKIIPLKGFPITSSWELVWLKNKELSPVSKAYVEYLTAHKSDITENYFHWLNEIDIGNH